MTIWEYNPPPAELVRKYRKELHVGNTIAELLARLDFSSIEEARGFLDPRLSGIGDPYGVANLETAAKRISQAIDDRQRIVICGDYDVDGVTSTALLVAILRRFGTYPDFIVPLRLEEGYGLTRKAAERALVSGNQPDLFIALDCGTNSIEEAQLILDTGCDLVIVDHHQSKETLPEGVILVNPHVHKGEKACQSTLCTVGLVFKLAHGLLKHRREKADTRAFEIKLRHYLDLVSMGTVADLVPLRNENRIFARIGLQELAKTQKVGLRSLMKVAGVQSNFGVKPMDVSFRLGPRINASGRLADAAVAVELLLGDDRSFCMETSLELDSFNRERQEIEKEITDEAMKQIEATQKENVGLVVYGEDWHPGVVGIVASRVSKAYNRPAIVLGTEGVFAKGSGRSIEGINLVEALSGFSERLESWGGHPMAVGISLAEENVDDFREYFDNAIREYLATHELHRTIRISGWMRLEEANERFLDELEKLEPFGQENPEPIFGIKGVVFKLRPQIFKDQHFRFSLNDKKGRSVSGVAWKMAERIPPMNTEVEIACRLAWTAASGAQKSPFAASAKISLSSVRPETAWRSRS
ncbi:MAG: single-stranded-DNA-specific exonuclease RecJ, partial [Verrucomicrobiota bacterium]